MCAISSSWVAGSTGSASRATRPGAASTVTAVERHDLASATSSSSTKLIHGGLRYLEYYEFRLVREALSEREVLLESAPHIIWPLRFVLPHEKTLRPAWMIQIGLFLYDHLGGRKRLPGSKRVSLEGEALFQRAEARLRASASSIPIAGSTTRGWWPSMRSMRASAAPRS